MRRIEVNDDEHYIFMALRIGYCYVGYIIIMCVTKCLNPFFRLYEASEELNKYVIGLGVWSDNSTAAFFVSFIVAVLFQISREFRMK